MRVIGITGGVASGKSTVAKILEEKGFPVIDTDHIAHQLLNQNTAIQKRVKETLGSIDRGELRKMIFADCQKKTQLEEILHPEIKKEIDRQLGELRQHQPPPPAAIVVVPLLLEAGWEGHTDLIVTVASDKNSQRERLVKRDGIDPALADQMIASQMSLREKVRRSDIVIQNVSTLGDLHQRVDEVMNQLLQ